MRLVSRLICWLTIAVALSALLAGVASAAKIYVYQQRDGSRLITDHPRIERGYRLVKIYGVSEAGWAATNSRYSPQIRPVPSRYDPMILTTASRFGVDAALVKAVMHVESGFNPQAVSVKGASGLMQLMPQTATRYGVERIFDPRQNIAGGVKYLRFLLREFDGDTRLALAGYNAGENAVIKHDGVPPFPETRGYVSKVMSLYQRYRDTR